MNSVILSATALTGIVIGFVIYRVYRSTWACIVLPLVLFALVWFALPTPMGTALENAPDRAAVSARLADLEPFRPIEVLSHGYVGSQACRECHQENHASWFASYHRTMTQLPTPDTVLGDFDDAVVHYQDDVYHLRREGELCVVDMPNYSNPIPGARTQSAVVLTTGSHHMQLYWFATGAGRMIGLLPLAYLRESEEWIPRGAAFLRPRPIHSFETGRWNETCSKCHSTHRMGRLFNQQGWDTHVGEFGISCEACHGPGGDHIKYRKEAATVAAASDPIVNPASLPKQRAAEVCGQCHSIFFTPRGNDEANLHGTDYTPGDILAESRLIVRRDSPEYIEQQKAMKYPTLESLLNESYYNDGMVRVSGREYNALTDSACFQKGEMTCFSCHKLHKSKSDDRSLAEWANDQLHPDAIGDNACLRCHEESQYGESHTHHARGSSGTSCYNCHMPHTTYGLLKAIRSHTISSPDVGKDRSAGRPNACNLCHLDKTLEWSADHLQDWYEIDPPEFNHDEQSVAASLLWLVSGNAANRALAAWSMGWSDAQKISGKDWQAPFLARALNDDYEALRLIARRSLQSMPGFETMKMDVVNASTFESRSDAIRQIWDHWMKQQGPAGIHRPELLIEQSQLDIDRLNDLHRRRDNSPMSLAE